MDGWTVPQIRKITNHHDHSIINWIHLFNEKERIDSIISKKNTITNSNKFDNNREKDS
jgi:hypothetical protein